MKPLGFDLETTGTDPTEDHIVTYSFVGVNSDGRTAFTRSGLINPGVPIPTEASDVHGITTEVAERDGVAPREGLGHILTALQYAYETESPLCIFNARFDLTLVWHELARHSMQFGHWDKLHVIDPLVLDKQHDRYRRGSRKLIDVAAHYGIRLDDAHSADADALAATLTYQAMAKKYPSLIHLPIHDLHTAQIAWAAEQARSLQAHFRKTDPEAVAETRWPYYTSA